MSVAIGNFSWPGAPTSKSVTGLGFQPDLTFLVGQFDSADLVSFGMAANSTNQCSFGAEAANHASPEVVHSVTDALGMNSFTLGYTQDSDGFTLTENGADGFANDDTFAYMCLGGLDEVDIRSISTSSSVSPNLGWQPDVVFLLTAEDDVAAESYTSYSAFTFGVQDFASPSSAKGGIRGAENSKHFSEASVFSTTEIRTRNSSTTTAWTFTQDASGYTISHGAGATRHCVVVAVKGLEMVHDAAVVPQATGTETFDVSAMGGDPEAAFVIMLADEANAAYGSFGFSDFTNNRSVVWEPTTASVNTSLAGKLSDSGSDDMELDLTFSSPNVTLNYTEVGTYSYASSDRFIVAMRTGAGGGATETSGFGFLPIGI